MTPKQVALVQDSFAKVALTSAAVECARSRSSRQLQHPANLPLKQRDRHQRRTEKTATGSFAPIMIIPGSGLGILFPLAFRSTSAANTGPSSYEHVTFNHGVECSSPSALTKEIHYNQSLT
jgi:hypothetical protein